MLKFLQDLARKDLLYETNKVINRQIYTYNFYKIDGKRFIILNQ